MKALFEKISSMFTDAKSQLWSSNKFVFTYTNVIAVSVYLATWATVSLKIHMVADVPAGANLMLATILGVSTTSKIMHKKEETTQAKNAQDSTTDNTPVEGQGA